jgi:hypothetical protein
MGSALVAQKFSRFETWRQRARPACQEKINAGIAAYVILHPFALSIDINCKLLLIDRVRDGVQSRLLNTSRAACGTLCTIIRLVI